jgi:SAM-dependent methyltransferase
MPHSQEICPLCCNSGRFFYTDSKNQHRYLRCHACALIWLSAQHYLSPADEHDHYQLHENDPQDLSYRRFLKQLWDPLRAKLTPGAIGLDYGSGPGPTLHLMATEDGFPCTHYDPLFHPDTSVLTEQYDFITCSETVEHFHHPQFEFKQLMARLKPGGWLGIMTSRFVPGIHFATWHYRRDPTHVLFYSDETFIKIAEEYGQRAPTFVSDSVVLL